jgi:hypothetical protein
MWELQTDLELWLLDLQLGDAQFSSFWGIALVLICPVTIYVCFKIAIWRSKFDVARQLLSSASFIFPPPVVRFSTVVLGAFVVIAVGCLVAVT